MKHVETQCNVDVMIFMIEKLNLYYLNPTGLSRKTESVLASKYK